MLRSKLALACLLPVFTVTGCCKHDVTELEGGTSDEKVTARLFLGAQGKAAIVFVDTSGPVRDIVQIHGDYTQDCEWFRYRRVSFRVTEGDAGRPEFVLVQNGNADEALVCSECWEFKVGKKTIAAPMWQPVRK